MKFLRAFIRQIEESETNLGLWMVSFFFLISLRLLVEAWLSGFKSLPAGFLFSEWTHNVLFFLLSFLLLLPIFQYFSRTSLQISSNMLLFGFLIILSPPIIDFVVSNGTGLWSFYIFDGFSGLLVRYFTFFGDRPDMGITYGVRFEVAVVSVLFGIYVFFRTKKIFRSFLASISAYSLLFFLGTFPSWAAILINGLSDGRWTINASDVAAIFLSPISVFSHTISDPRSVLNEKMSILYGALLPFVIGSWLFFSSRNIFQALWKNSRFPQAVYHSGLLFVGIGLSFVFSGTKLHMESLGIFDGLAVFLILSGVISAWLASVVVNDFFDRSIDRETNASRPLITGDISLGTYGAIGASFFLASMMLPAIVSPKSALLLLLYQSLAWTYSAPPFRLKRFPIVASFVSAVASLLILFLGFTLFSPDGSIALFPFSFAVLFLFAYSVSIPLKDFKDVRGDRKDSVWTIPVLLGARNAKLLLGSAIFASFLSSVFVFRAPALFLPAVAFGGASFWTVFSMRERIGRITYRTIFWWVLAFVAGYGLFVVRALF